MHRDPRLSFVILSFWTLELQGGGGCLCSLGRWGSNACRVARFLLSPQTQYKPKKILKTTADSRQQCLRYDCETIMFLQTQRGLLCLIITLVFRKHNCEETCRSLSWWWERTLPTWPGSGRYGKWVRPVRCGLSLVIGSAPQALLSPSCFLCFQLLTTTASSNVEGFCFKTLPLIVE